MELELSREDFTLLKAVLGRYVSDLRMEIAGTENAGWREEMHTDEDRAKGLLARLDATAEADELEDFRIIVRGFILNR